MLNFLSRWVVALALAGSVALPGLAQHPPSDSSKIYTFVARMPVYPSGRGYVALLADLRREFWVASGAVGCAAPTFPVRVNLLVGPSGVIYHAEFVNNLPPTNQRSAAGGQSTVADMPPGPPLPAACAAALAAAIRKLPRLQPGVESGRRETVRITLPLIPEQTK